MNLCSCDFANLIRFYIPEIEVLVKKMIYGKVPMMIFTLASGYLLAVYLLLALAKRTGKKTTPASVSLASQKKHKQEVIVTPKVTEATSLH